MPEAWAACSASVQPLSGPTLIQLKATIATLERECPRQLSLAPWAREPAMFLVLTKIHSLTSRFQSC